MRVQSVTSQPNFSGKLTGKGVMILKDSHWDVPEGLDKSIFIELPDNLLNKLRDMVKEKPYDVFISKNKQDANFYNIAANKTFEEAEKIREYTVKVHSNAIKESIMDAINEAMKMYEKFIAKGIKG